MFCEYLFMHISHFHFVTDSLNWVKVFFLRRFLLSLFIKAAEIETQTGEADAETVNISLHQIFWLWTDFHIWLYWFPAGSLLSCEELRDSNRQELSSSITVSFPVTWCLDHKSLREKDLRPPGSAEAPDREETSRSDHMFQRKREKWWVSFSVCPTSLSWGEKISGYLQLLWNMISL